MPNCVPLLFFFSSLMPWLVVVILLASTNRATLTNVKAEEILKNGVRLANGQVVEADVLALANGFVKEILYGVEVVGKDGETLTEHWQKVGGLEAYNCYALAGLSNFFFTMGK
jgi:hypothetical protein